MAGSRAAPIAFRMTLDGSQAVSEAKKTVDGVKSQADRLKSDNTKLAESLLGSTEAGRQYRRHVEAVGRHTLEAENATHRFREALHLLHPALSAGGLELPFGGRALGAAAGAGIPALVGAISGAIALGLAKWGDEAKKTQAGFRDVYGEQAGREIGERINAVAAAAGVPGAKLSEPLALLQEAEALRGGTSPFAIQSGGQIAGFRLRQTAEGVTTEPLAPPPGAPGARVPENIAALGRAFEQLGAISGADIGAGTEAFKTLVTSFAQQERQAPGQEYYLRPETVGALPAFAQNALSRALGAGPQGTDLLRRLAAGTQFTGRQALEALLNQAPAINRQFETLPPERLRAFEEARRLVTGGIERAGEGPGTSINDFLARGLTGRPRSVVEALEYGGLKGFGVGAPLGALTGGIGTFGIGTGAGFLAGGAAGAAIGAGQEIYKYFHPTGDLGEATSAARDFAAALDGATAAVKKATGDSVSPTSAGASPGSASRIEALGGRPLLQAAPGLSLLQYWAGRRDIPAIAAPGSQGPGFVEPFAAAGTAGPLGPVSAGLPRPPSANVERSPTVSASGSAAATERRYTPDGGSFDLDQYDKSNAEISEEIDKLQAKLDSDWTARGGTLPAPADFEPQLQERIDELVAQQTRARLQLQASSSAPYIGEAPALPFAEGGVIAGPGTGTSDSIAALLPGGSYVLNAESTKRYGSLLQGLADGGVPVRVSNGERYFPPEEVSRIGLPLLEALNRKGGAGPIALALGGSVDLRPFASGGNVADLVDSLGISSRATVPALAENEGAGGPTLNIHLPNGDRLGSVKVDFRGRGMEMFEELNRAAATYRMVQGGRIPDNIY